MNRHEWALVHTHSYHRVTMTMEMTGTNIMLHQITWLQRGWWLAGSFHTAAVTVDHQSIIWSTRWSFNANPFEDRNYWLVQIQYSMVLDPVQYCISSGLDPVQCGESTGSDAVRQVIRTGPHSVQHGASTGSHLVQHDLSTGPNPVQHGITNGTDPVQQVISTGPHSVQHGVSTGPVPVHHGMRSSTKWYEHWSRSSTARVRVVVQVLGAAVWKEQRVQSPGTEQTGFTIKQRSRTLDVNISAETRRINLPLHSLTLFLLASLGLTDQSETL